MPAFRTPAALLLPAALALPASADLVRWINPAGGSFADASNWDAGHPPLPADTAVFDLPATYTVTLDADRDIADCLIGAGAVTIDLAEHELTTLTVTCTAGLARISNGTVHGRVSANGGSVVVLSTAEFDRGGAAGNAGQLTIAGTVGKSGDGAGFFSIASSSTVTLASTGVIGSRSLTVNGTLHVEAGHINAEVLSVNGALVMDGGHIQAEFGPMLNPGSQSHLFNGATIAGAGIDAQGQLLIEGDGTDASVSQVRGLLRLIGGGKSHPQSLEMSVAGSGRVEVGDGGVLLGRIYRMDQGVLRLEQGSTGPTGGLQSYGAYPDTGLELVIDALANPRFAPRSFWPLAMAFDAELAGSLSIELLNDNALRVGDEVTLFTSTGPVINGAFSAINQPTLPGGRTLTAVITPASVTLRVTAGGGNPCWSADFNGDGEVATDQDIEAFFACLGGHCCPTCGEPDFNNDGDVATDQDIEAFFRVLSGSPC